MDHQFPRLGAVANHEPERSTIHTFPKQAQLNHNQVLITSFSELA